MVKELKFASAGELASILRDLRFSVGEVREPTEAEDGFVDLEAGVSIQVPLEMTGAAVVLERDGVFAFGEPCGTLDALLHEIQKAREDARLVVSDNPLSSMAEAFHAAAMLGNLADDRTAVLVGGVVARLCEIDSTLIRYAEEEDRGDDDHTEASEDLLDEAALIVKRLHPDAEVYFCDERTDGGRLRVEIPGSPVDRDSPLYFSGPPKDAPALRPRGG